MAQSTPPQAAFEVSPSRITSFGRSAQSVLAYILRFKRSKSWARGNSSVAKWLNNTQHPDPAAESPITAMTACKERVGLSIVASLLTDSIAGRATVTRISHIKREDMNASKTFK